MPGSTKAQHITRIVAVFVSLLLCGIIGFGVTGSSLPSLLQAQSALAAGPQVTVMYPLAGRLTSSPRERPPHHHFWGNYAIDDAAPKGTPVYARFANSTGRLSLSLGGTFNPCRPGRSAGTGLIVHAAIDGRRVGSVYYAHLAPLSKTTGPISNGAKIATLWNGKASGCWTGPHVHVEPKGSAGRACFVRRALNSSVNGRLALGVIGGGYATRDNQTCPAGAQTPDGGQSSVSTVAAWGSNREGQLGDGTTTNSSTPVQVHGLSGVTAAIAGGEDHSVALRSDGTVWAWGGNLYGQLGDGTTTNSSTPVQVRGLSGVTAVAAGDYCSVALRSDGTVWAWGFNANGQLGDGTTTSSSTPVRVQGLSGVTAIAAEAPAAYHVMALRSDGTVWAWGSNAGGQLGDGTRTTRFTPVQVHGLSGVTAIGVGFFLSMALRSDGTMWAWGHNLWGQLGDGTTTTRLTPVQVRDLSGVTAIAAGGHHSLALRTDGTVWAWGHNSWGQMGNGTTTDSSTPVQLSGLAGVIAISAGSEYSLGLRSDGTVWAWGYNADGQLGNGTTSNSSTPGQVSGLSGVTAINAGHHSLALHA
jgi:alpha-tubulin suppressor-like RCC1 family protein